MDNLLFTEDVAARYRISERKAREMMQRMPCIRIGARRAITETRLAAWEQAEADRLLEGPARRGRKPKPRTAPVVHLSEMRCPTRRELREMEAKARAAR